MYVEKLVARRTVLGLDVPEPGGGGGDGGGAGADQQQQQGGDGAESDGEGPETQQEAADAAGAQPLLSALLAGAGDGQQQPVPDGHAAMHAVLSGAVARTVFQQSLKAAAAAATRGVTSTNYLQPSSSSSSGGGSNMGGLGFRAGFLDVLSRYSSPGVQQLRREVLASISQDFGQVCAAAGAARAVCWLVGCIATCVW
jgi:hypothetical protein